MLKIGDSIKQVKEIKGFNFVGEDFKVTEIESGTVVFGNSKMGVGVMSYNEFEKYFKKNVIKREWQRVNEISRFPKEFINSCNVTCKTNGKKVVIKSNDYTWKKIKGIASCHEDDEFDLIYGIKLACERYMENLINMMNSPK